MTTPTAAPAQTIEQLLEPLLGRAYGLALHLTRNRADAEDLVQESALAACRGFSTFKQGTNFKAWFFRVLTNCFYARYRRARREGAQLDLEEVTDLYLYERTAELGWHDGPSDPAERFLSRLHGDQVDEALLSLPEEFRVVATLYLIEDLSYAEIAAIVDIPVGTVRSRLHRGRKLLQQRLWRAAVDSGLVPEIERKDG